MSPSDSPELDDDTIEEEERKPIDVLFRVVDSLFNLDLLRDARDEIEIINWQRLSYTTFYLGLIGLMLWVVYLVFISSMNYILTPDGLVTTGNRIIHVGPLAPAAIFITFIMISRSFERIRTEVWSEEPDDATQTRRVRIFLISVCALVVAGAMRGATYEAAVITLGDDPYRAELIGLMLVDVGYISVLLIGIGGLGASYFGLE